MNPRLQTLVLAALVMLTFAGFSWCQPGQEPAKTDKEPSKQAEKLPQPELPRDPTSPSPKLKELLYSEKASKGGPAGPAPKIPNVALRGRVVSKDQPPVAILEVDGRMYSISKGSMLSGGNNTYLRILDIDSAEVRIEVSPLSEIIILR